MSYPPEPWYLGGSLLVSAFRVPVAALPSELAEALPRGRTPVVVAGHAVVGVAFARYVPGGVLAYDELLVAVPSLDRAALRYTIPQIWVDSPVSQQGGRELWGIPKQLAGFERSDSADAAAVAAGTGLGPVARLDARFGRTLPGGMRQFALPTHQADGLGATLSRNRVIGRIGALSARWDFAAAGPLGYLAGRRPFASFALRDASIVFGMDVRRS
jgi:hypothetical protein